MRFARRELLMPEKTSAIRALKGEKRSGVIFLSGRHCNLKCRHCLTDSGPNRQRKANPLTAISAIKNIRPILEKGSIEFLGVSGGESMLNPYYSFVIAMENRKSAENHGHDKPPVVILTNGRIFNNHVHKLLKPVKGDIKIMHSTDDFHPEPAQIGEFRKHGFDVYRRDEKFEIAGLGRAYELHGKVDWKTSCDAAGIDYIIDGNELRIESKPIRSHRFKVTEEGGLHLCGYGGFVFANIKENSSTWIAKELIRNEYSLEFLTRGPLGLADVYGKLKQAVEIFREKGSCAVCHALSEKLI